MTAERQWNFGDHGGRHFATAGLRSVTPLLRTILARAKPVVSVLGALNPAVAGREPRAFAGISPVPDFGRDFDMRNRRALETLSRAVKPKARHLLAAPVLAIRDCEPRSLSVIRAIGIEFLSGERAGHQRRYVAPKVKAAKVPARPTDPWLGTAHVLDHHWDMVTGSERGFALNAETLVEQPIERDQFFARRIGPDRRSLRLREFPRHRHVAVLLARRGGDDNPRILELRAVQRGDILKQKLPLVSLIAVGMFFNIDADHVKPRRDVPRASSPGFAT